MNPRSLWCCAGLVALTTGCATILGFEDPEEARGQTNVATGPDSEASADGVAMIDGVADVGVTNDATTTAWGFKDDFASSVRSAHWEPDTNCLARFEQQDGVLKVLVPSGRKVWGDYVSHNSWPIVGAHASVNVRQVVADEGTVGLAVKTDAGDRYDFSVAGGSLSAIAKLGGTYQPPTAFATYDPSMHAWLRIHYDAPAAEVVFETASNGSDWVRFARETWRLDSTNVHVVLLTYRAAPPAGAVLPSVFDNFELAKNP